MRKGSKFEQITKKSLEKYGFVYRFRDVAVNPQGARRVPVPADFLLIRNGKAYFFECKSYGGSIYLPRAIREVQLKYANKITYHDAPYYFLFWRSGSKMVHALRYEALVEFMKEVKTANERKFELFPHTVILHFEKRRIRFEPLFQKTLF